MKRTSATNKFAGIISNYNFVAHNIASLSLQRGKVTKDPIICTFTTLQNMIQNVHTAFGNLDTHYGGDTWEVKLNPPPQILGQGNGSAPEICAIVSTPVLKCLHNAGHGA